jgi:hypothetical protein
MANPDDTLSISLPLTAFADDTNLLGNDHSQTKSIDELIRDAQNCFTTWNELLHALCSREHRGSDLPLLTLTLFDCRGGSKDSCELCRNFPRP